MFEHRSEPVLNRIRFLFRLGRAFVLTVLIVIISVLIGTLGYRLCVGDTWGDSFHHACLVLGEHFPKHDSMTTAGKLFSGLYLLYARLVFFSVMAILTLPILHRILHKLHLDAETKASDSSGDGI